MKIVNVHEAKTHLSRLIQEALDGEEVIIARGNRPLVKLALVETARRTRTTGWAKGLIESTDDFDAPLEDFDAYQ